MEALSLQKPLVAVINDRLMNNHQTELARQLCKDGHLLHTTHRYLQYYCVYITNLVTIVIINYFAVCNFSYRLNDKI